MEMQCFDFNDLLVVCQKGYLKSSWYGGGNFIYNLDFHGQDEIICVSEMQRRQRNICICVQDILIVVLHYFDL